MIPSIVHLDIRVEKRSDFSIHFPEGYLVIAETASNKLPFFTIKSILKHFGIDWQDIELVYIKFYYFIYFYYFYYY